MCGIIARFTCPIYDFESISTWMGTFWNGEIEWKSICANFILLISSNTDLINPPIWTLRIEMVMIFVLPVMLVLLKKVPIWICYLLSFVLSVIFGRLVYLPVFVIGMWIRIVYIEKNNSQYYHKKIINVLCFTLGIFFLDSRYILMTYGIEVSGLLELFIHNLTGVGTAFILYSILDLHIKRNVFSILGDYSYYFYLLHFIVLLWFRFIVGKYGYIVYGLACFSVTCVLALLLKKFDNILNHRIQKLKFLKRYTKP